MIGDTNSKLRVAQPPGEIMEIEASPRGGAAEAVEAVAQEWYRSDTM